MTKQPSIAVVCSTYRNPEKPSLTRLYGIYSLIDQIRSQNYDGDVKIVIVDDSNEPHPFIEGLRGDLGDQLSYFHVPRRNLLSDTIKRDFSYAASFLPTDEQLATSNVWREHLSRAEAWQNYLPFDYEFAKNFKLDLPGQIRAERPTIGMKKNFGCAAYLEKFGQLPDIFVYVDDDDLRSPDYLQIVADGIKGNNFARVAKTFCHNVSPDPEHRVWAEIDFQFQQDVNGQWYIPAAVMDSNSYKYHDGGIIERPVHDLYARNLLLAWPIISHDGALHNYTGETWHQAAKEFGGFFPTSFSEDIITHRMMHQLPGFKAAKIEVQDPPFIRCSDGRNASDFYATKILTADEVPEWCHLALKPLYEAVAAPQIAEYHTDKLRETGRQYLKQLVNLDLK